MKLHDILQSHPCVHPVVADCAAAALSKYHTSPAQLVVQGNVVHGELEVAWQGPPDERTRTTFQRARIVEDGAIGVACLLLSAYTDRRVTEVAKRGERADYYVGLHEGDKQEMLEVSGTDRGNLDSRARDKRDQLLANPYGKGGYVAVSKFDEPRASLLHVTQADVEEARS